MKRRKKLRSYLQCNNVCVGGLFQRMLLAVCDSKFFFYSLRTKISLPTFRAGGRIKPLHRYSLDYILLLSLCSLSLIYSQQGSNDFCFDCLFVFMKIDGCFCLGWWCIPKYHLYKLNLNFTCLHVTYVCFAFVFFLKKFSLSSSLWFYTENIKIL